MATKKLLDLDALYDRYAIRIKGETYELRTNDELSPITSNRIAALGTRMAALAAKQPLTAEEERELEDLPTQICRIVLMAPFPVIDGLDSEQRWWVCQTFLNQRARDLETLLATTSLVAAGAVASAPVTSPSAPGETSTGASSSPS